MKKLFYIFALIALVQTSCVTIKGNASNNSSYSLYTFSFIDSSINNLPAVRLELFGKITNCNNDNGIFHINQGFIDSLNFDFERDLDFLGNPKVLRSDGVVTELLIIGFLKDNHFKLTKK